MRSVCALLVALLLLAVPAAAQEAPKAEVFAGYSNLRMHPGSGANGFNLNGWNTSVVGNFNRWFGIKADFAGQYGSPWLPNPTPPPVTVKVDTNTHSFLFGPQFSYRKNERATPFAHALFGAARVEGSTFGANVSESGFAMALGGGVDLRVNDAVAVRIGQLDYLLTRLADNNRHNFRYSTGIVFRFGT